MSVAGAGQTKVKVGSTRHGNVGTRQLRGVDDSSVQGSMLAMLSLADRPTLLKKRRETSHLDPGCTVLPGLSWV